VLSLHLILCYDRLSDASQSCISLEQDITSFRQYVLAGKLNFTIFSACFTGYLRPGNHPGLRWKIVWHAKNSSSQIQFTQSHLMEILEEVDTVQYKPSLSISVSLGEGVPIANYKQRSLTHK